MLIIFLLFNALVFMTYTGFLNFRNFCLLLVTVLFNITCSTSQSSSNTSNLKIANPASQNCTKQGGQLLIEKNPNGAEYGVCRFTDNRQCEEWALLRGDCPLGGKKITGYGSDAARYCTIRGGVYKFRANATAIQPEQGDCKLSKGIICDAHDFYSGDCPP